MRTTYDQPENRGVMNGLKRAKQFTELWYSCPKDYPICFVLYPDGEKAFYGSYQHAGMPAKGLPYSSAIKHQKLIGYHVSVESFMTAIRDPESILYRKNLFHGDRENAAAWYGTVCSSLVSYVWDLPIQHTCANWPLMEDVDALGQPAAEELKLLDALKNMTHITVITGIEREENGKVRRIEISESTLPNCRSTWFTPEEFRLCWYGDKASPYQIYRRRDHSGISYMPIPFVRVAAEPERGIEGDPELPAYAYNSAVQPDHGCGSNYLTGAEPVTIDLLEEKWTSVEIADAAGQKTVYPVNGGKVCPGEQPCGYYSVTALTPEGERSMPAEYAVVGYADVLKRQVFCPGEEMELSLAVKTEGDRPLYYSIAERANSNTLCREVIAEEDAKRGTLRILAPEGEGEYQLALGTKNRFGIYASENYYFSVRG